MRPWRGVQPLLDRGFPGVNLAGWGQHAGVGRPQCTQASPFSMNWAVLSPALNK